MKLTATIVFTLTVTLSSGQQYLECKNKFNRLIEIEQQNYISDSQLNESLTIAKNLYEKRYVDFIDSISNNTIYVSKNLTHTFASITRKRCDSIGVSYYLKYLSITAGSAEEERSFGLERLFKQCPETVLRQIDSSYYEDLAWGFMNNRYYGPTDPFENDGYKAFTVYDKPPEPKLNSENYTQIFNETYPTLKSHGVYSDDIKFLLKKIDRMLE